MIPLSAITISVTITITTTIHSIAIIIDSFNSYLALELLTFVFL